jgi:hypothetical protein
MFDRKPLHQAMMKNRHQHDAGYGYVANAIGWVVDGAVGAGDGGFPPAAQLIPTRISEMPMIRTTEPVTTGGNQRSRRLT